jgi:hypothetical protein
VGQDYFGVDTELSDEQLAGLAAPKIPRIVGRKKRQQSLGG